MPHIKCLEKLLTFGTGPNVNMDMEGRFHFCSPIVTLGRLSCFTGNL